MKEKLKFYKPVRFNANICFCNIFIIKSYLLSYLQTFLKGFGLFLVSDKFRSTVRKLSVTAQVLQKIVIPWDFKPDTDFVNPSGLQKRNQKFYSPNTKKSEISLWLWTAFWRSPRTGTANSHTVGRTISRMYSAPPRPNGIKTTFWKSNCLFHSWPTRPHSLAVEVTLIIEVFILSIV